MNIHELKILSQHYHNVKNGTKTFEIRENDRAFQKGDQVILRLFSREIGYVNRPTVYPDLSFKIGDVYPIDSERVVFSLLPHIEERS